jgi:predicted PurR-regulated permease PerM
VKEPSLNTRQAIAYGITLFFFGVVALWIVYLVWDVLLVLYVAGLFAIGFSPIVRRLERRRVAGVRKRRLPRWAAILALYVILLGTVAGVLALVIPPLINQAQELWTNLPGYLDGFQRYLVQKRLITHRYTWSEVLRNVPSPSVAVVGIVGALKGALSAIGALVTIIILPYYLLLEAQSLEAGFLRLFRPERRAQISRITHDVTLKVSAWLGGQLLLSFIIGSTAAIGLWLLGVPYFYVLAVLCGFGELIPIVGPILSAIPAILVALTVSLETGAFTAIYFVLQQFVENHFLVPRVMQRQVGVSAVTVIAALLIGSKLLGLLGALLAVPTAAIVQVVLDEYLESNGRQASPAA